MKNDNNIHHWNKFNIRLDNILGKMRLGALVRVWAMLGVLLVGGIVWSVEVAAKGIKGQYTLEADHVEYFAKQDVMVATGHVEVFRRDYLLKADKVVYDKAKNIATATGNVSLIKPNGEELYASSLELDDALKEILAIELKARLRDHNVFTAGTAVVHSDRIVFNKATYSPCRICADGQPQWQIRASKIDFERKKDTVFKNNIFDMYGIPVFYLPYMRVASYDAEPRSGFLIPHSYKYKAIYGHGIRVPYYLRMNNSNDLMYSPMITTTDQVLHSAEYRFMLQKEYTNSIQYEYIRNTHKKIYGSARGQSYLKSDINHKFNEQISFKSHLEHVSDKSYLKNYHDKTKNYLSSFGELSYVGEDSRLRGTAHHFQELRNFQSDITVAPIIEYDKSFIYGDNKYSLVAEMANISKRKHGVTDRANIKLGWFRNYTYYNHVIDVTSAANGSFYKFSKAETTQQTNGAVAKRFNYTFARVVPEFTTAWKYPLLLTNQYSTTYVAPLVKFIALPNKIYNKNIANEDSQDLEINDGNVFDTDRYPGYDRLENGSRLAYGLSGAGYFTASQYPRYGFVLGQNYRFKRSDEYSVNSGLKNTHFSDYVGKVALQISRATDLQYMFQLDKSNYKLRRGELSSTFTFDFPDQKIHRAVFNLTFSSYNYKQNLVNITRAVTAGGAIYFLQEWHVGSSITKNFVSGKSQLIESSVSLGYKGQCTNIIFSATKNNTADKSRKIRKGGFSYSVEWHLKNIN